jgi:signal recognition particle subunit SEC65
MLGQILGGLFNKEEMINETLRNTIEDVAEELNCDAKQISIMIDASEPQKDEKGNEIKNSFTCFVYQSAEGKRKRIREITLTEILGDE